MAVGRSVFTPRPKRGSEPNNNAEWMWINIAALLLVSYYAVCSVFALGFVFFFFFFFFYKGIYHSKNAGKFCTKGTVSPHKACSVKKIKNKSACIFRIEPKQNSEDEEKKKNTLVRKWLLLRATGIITCRGSKRNGCYSLSWHELIGSSRAR